MKAQPMTISQSISKLAADSKRWSPEDRREIADQLRKEFLSKVQQ
jgi:hypothetical protein